MIRLKNGVLAQSTLGERMIEESAIIVDMNNSSYLRLNRTAWEMLSLLTRFEEETAILELQRNMDIPLNTLTADVHDFVQALRVHKLIEDIPVQEAPVVRKG